MTPIKAVVITAAVIFYVINVSLEYVTPKVAENCKPWDSREGKDPINENVQRNIGIKWYKCHTECMKSNQTRNDAYFGRVAPVCSYRTQYERSYNRTDIFGEISSDCDLKCMGILPATNQLECLADFCCVTSSYFCAGPGEPHIKQEECHQMITTGKAKFYVGDIGSVDIHCKRK